MENVLLWVWFFFVSINLIRSVGRIGSPKTVYPANIHTVTRQEDVIGMFFKLFVAAAILYCQVSHYGN